MKTNNKNVTPVGTLKEMLELLLAEFEEKGGEKVVGRIVKPFTKEIPRLKITISLEKGEIEQ